MVGLLGCGKQRGEKFSAACQTRLDCPLGDAEFDGDICDGAVGEVVENHDGAMVRVELRERLDQGNVIRSDLDPRVGPGTFVRSLRTTSVCRHRLRT